MARHFPNPDWQIFDAQGERKYLTGGERVRFLKAADRFEPVRRAYCYLLAFTGCRVSEAVAFAAHQVNAEEGRITFLTLKQRRAGISRRVPVPPALVAMLAALPVSDSGKLWTMHRGTAWRLVKEVMACSGIEGPMACPKGLRHGFGIHAAQCSVPASLIKKWMGHATLFMTIIYIDAVGIEEQQFASRMW